MTFSSLLSQQVARSGSCLPLDFHCCGRRTHQRQSAIRHCVCQSRVCELLRLKRSPHACSLGHRLNELQQPSAVSKDYFLPVPAQQNEVLRGTLYHITNNCSKAMSIRIHFLLPCSIWFCHARARMFIVYSFPEFLNDGMELDERFRGRVVLTKMVFGEGRPTIDGNKMCLISLMKLQVA